MKKKRIKILRKFHRKKRNELIRELFIMIFAILFSLTYFYLDPQITGYSTFHINIADVLNLTLNSPINNTRTNNMSIMLNITQEGNITNFIIYGGNTSDLDYNNVLYRNNSITGVQANNITYNFTALPIKPQGDFSDGLVLLMHFDNITNFENATNGSNFTVYDWSLNNNNGTGATNSSNGGPQFNVTGGKFGGTFEFDGKDDYISIANSNSLNFGTGDFTLASWFKTTETELRAIIETNKVEGGFNTVMKSIRINDGGFGNFKVYVRGTGTDDEIAANTSGLLTDGNWHFIVGTYASNNINLYFDGKLNATGSWNAGNTNTNELWFINSVQGGASGSHLYTDGTIDEVAVWNRTLSSTEISNMYNLSIKRIYYWKANATDINNNFNDTGINQFVTNNSAPNITSINITTNGPTNKSNETLTGNFNFADDSSMSLNETRWYNNTIEITSFKNFTQINSANMTAGDNWIFSAKVFDGLEWSNWTNSSSHSVQNNSAPVFSGLIPNQTWAEDTYLTNAINLSTFFSDQENDNLNYTTIGNKIINIIINNSLVSFSQVQDWFGVEYVILVANDSNLTRQSNNITLTIYQMDESALVSQSGGGNLRRDVNIGLIATSPKTIYLKDKIRIPLTIKNTGSTTLQGIKLSAFSSEQKIKTSLENNFILTLAPGNEETTNIDIFSNLNKEDSVEIIINAEVSSPSLKDSTKIIFNAVEFGASNKSIIVPRLQYAKELFKKNKECEDFNLLLNQAQSLLNENKLNDAESILDKAINGCNDIIILQPKKLEFPIKAKSSENFIILIESSIFVFLLIELILYYKKRKIFL